MGHDQSRCLVDDLPRQFESRLETLKYEYQKNLQEVDPLDRDALTKMLTSFNQLLVLFQHDFLELLVQSHVEVDDLHTQKFKVEAPPIDRKPKIAAWVIGGLPVGAGVYGALRMSWKKQCKFIRKHPAEIIGGLAVVAGAYGFIYMWQNKQRESIRKQLIAEFDEEIAPSLRDWAHGKIEAAQSDEKTAPPFGVLAHDKKAQ